MLLKVCGMHDPENIRAIMSLGIDLIGFIFYPPSPRYVGDSFESVATPGVGRVGVFVNETAKRMVETAHHHSLDYLQLHGNESPTLCDTLRQEGFKVIKAISVAEAADFRGTTPYDGHTDMLLFDTRCHSFGGSGSVFDWHLLDNYQGDTPFLLSGGITPDHAPDICRITHPRLAGVDLNSRFESSPGLKETKRIREFMNKGKWEKLGKL